MIYFSSPWTLEHTTSTGTINHTALSIISLQCSL